MQNINYDLIKLLHTTLDTIWRLEHYYIRDAKDAHCHSVPELEKMLEQERAHAKALAEELKMRCVAGVFN